eukprot:gene22543-34497_t
MTMDKQGVLLADVITKPSMSIMRQSFCSLERAKLPQGRLPNLSYEQASLNGDGYGVGWYTPRCAEGTPCVFTSTKPAWNDPNLNNLAEKVHSPVVFAHVRAAGPGTPVGEGCCHPFRAGKFLFMHNGLIGGFSTTQRTFLSGLDQPSFALAMKHNAIDSIVAFAMFLTKLVHLNPDRGGWDGMYSSIEILEALEQTVTDICATTSANGVVAPSLLNFMVTDGVVVLASRVVHNPAPEDEVIADPYYSDDSSEKDSKDSSGVPRRRRPVTTIAPASLYLSTGTVWSEDPSTGTYRMAQHDRLNRTVILTSEPLTDVRDEWVPVPPNHFVLCSEGKHIDVTFVPFPQKPKHVSSVIDLLQDWYEVDCLEQQGPSLRLSCNMTFTNSTASITCFTSCRDGSFLIGGSGDGCITVWDVPNSVQTEPRRHPGPVLALLVDDRPEEDIGLLFSSSNNELRVWDLAPVINRPPDYPIGMLVCTHVFKFTPSRGRILSLCGTADGLYLGCQAPQITFLDFVSYRRSESAKKQRSKTITYQTLSFKAAKAGEKEWLRPVGGTMEHNGFVNAMCIVGSELVSGGGDGRLLVWNNCKHAGVLHGHTSAIVSVVKHGENALSGSFDSTVREWNVSERACIRTLRYTMNAPVLSVFSCGEDVLFVVMENDKPRLSFWEYTATGGAVHHAVDCDASFSQITVAHVLKATDAKAVISIGGEQGGLVRLGNMSIGGLKVIAEPFSDEDDYGTEAERLLKEIVAFKTVSSDPSRRGECDAAAMWFAKQYEQMGCTVTSFASPHSNVVVLARLGWNPEHPTVVLYSHYDVVPAEDSWGLDDTPLDPWTLMGHDGYLYGRGSNDNKGPAVAQICAVRQLKASGKLQANILFVCEGDQECPNTGCIPEALQKARSVGWLEGVVAGVATNSTWLDDDHPSICYGSRGVLDVDVTVTGPKRDLHSGTHGGFVAEPLHDLIAVCAQLVDSTGNVQIPEFYDDVKGTAEDEAYLTEIAALLDVDKLQKNLGLPGFKGRHGTWMPPLEQAMSILGRNCLQPSMCITSLSPVTNSISHAISRVISSAAVARVSVRTVTGQDNEKLTRMISDHINYEFARRQSPNQVHCKATASIPWWEGDTSSFIFNAAAEAVEEVWGVKPLRTREGGTMSVLSVIQSQLGVPVVQVPLGQAGDNPHLANERFRKENLTKGVRVLQEMLVRVGEGMLPPPKKSGPPSVASAASDVSERE